MALREEFEKQGKWLFRWRSYLPLLIFPILLVALRNSENSEQVLGETVDDLYEVICIAISFLGLTIRCITIGYVPKGTSGRNTKRQVAEALNTTGIYSILRHPLYFGNFIIFLGIAMFVQVWWFSLIAILVFFIYYERIMFAEEEYLRNKCGISFIKWAEKTPVFLPKFKNWQQSCLTFSFRNVLKREYSGFFAIITSFTFVEIIGDLFDEGRLELDLTWIIFFSVGLLIYLVLRTLKKKTTILHIDGR
ncbi:MAG: hypothetical protein KAW92_12230 [Candidatus Cloacimonetes bacterium]|nr:hypothetical protein [Candidatus Cloacimonadota bacterium]